MFNFEINNKIMLFLTISSLHHASYVKNKIKLKHLLKSYLINIKKLYAVQNKKLCY